MLSNSLAEFVEPLEKKLSPELTSGKKKAEERE